MPLLDKPIHPSRESRGNRTTETTVLHTRVVTGTGGGPEKTILLSPRFLKHEGYRLVCAYMHPPGDPGAQVLQEKATMWQAPLVRIEDRGAWDWQVLTRLLNLCRRENVRIWHGHDYKSNAIGLFLNRFWPMKLVTTVHGWVRHTARTPLYYYIDRLCLPRYDKVICVSQDLYDVARTSGVSEKRCVLVENAIDTTEYRKQCSTMEAKRRHNIPPDRLVIGAVGRLSPEKGFDLLIRAVSQLLHKGLNVQLLIIGEGDERSRLERIINETGMANRIRLLGYRTDMRTLYECMDVFALSSLREGLPNVLLEAMALEVPVVATRIAGIPQLIKDNDNGLLVDPDSPASLEDGLSRLIQDRSLRNRLSQSGRDTIESHYSFRVRMNKVRSIYDQILHPKKQTLTSSRV